jgi:hypothetical protein
MCLNDHRGVAGRDKVTMPRVAKLGNRGSFPGRDKHFPS